MSHDLDDALHRDDADTETLRIVVDDVGGTRCRVDWIVGHRDVGCGVVY